MNEKLRELLDAINEKKLLVQKLAEDGKLEDARKAKDELKEMQEKFDLLKDVLDAPTPKNNIKPVPVEPEDSVKAFADAARNGFRLSNTMSEGSKADGGYTVPEDIQTRINMRRSSRFSLIDLVDVETVTTEKGSRVFKKRSQQTGFTKVGEAGKIGKKDTPQFEIMEYEISKFAGWFGLTNELLDDSDANITNVLVEWIGDESRVTRNILILAAIATKAKTAITGIDDMKKVINVDLGAAFKSTSRIITNDDGLQWLDTLKDGNNRYMLTPVPNEVGSMRLAVGGTTIEVKVIGNDDLPSDVKTTGKRKIPFIIGDLKEGIKFFDRKRLTISSSNVASAGDMNAFEQDLMLFRAIEREDCRVKDEKAFYNCELTIDDATVTG